MAIHLPHHKHHGQRFTRALRVPDDATALAWALPFQQTLDRELYCTELLVAPYDLDGLTPVVGREQGKSADDVQQVVAIQHPGDQSLLIVGTACSVFQFVQRERIGISPAVEVFFAMSSDGAELRLLAAGGNNDLIVKEKRCAAFTFGPTLFTVAQQLVDCFGDGVSDLGRLALDNHHWQTIQEQHNIRDDVMLGAEDAHLELAHSDKAVVVTVGKVHKTHGWASLTSLAVNADTGVFQQ